MTLPALTLTCATTQSNAPFSLGHAFVQGDVPAGLQLVAPFSEFQVTPKNFWPDGSLKFAILAGSANLTGGVPLSVALSIGTPAGGSALTTSDLKATGITAAIGCGAFGTVSWATTDWDAPFQTWASGPKMSSWIYRKSVGSDAHLVGWLEVRLFAGGAVEVLPWIENGYLNVVGPTSKNAAYSFTLGGTSRFSGTVNLPHHCRTPLVPGATLSHWLGTDPGVVATHDKAYLQSSRVVPAYRASVSSGSAAWTGLPSTYTPLQQGSHSPYMPDTGYSPAIGLLPEWDVLYLTSNDARAYAGVIFNAYSAGRYAIHYRDETTQHPLKLSSYPNLVPNDDGGITGINGLGASTTGASTPSASGTTPPVWDTPHHPALAYLAYLLTGRFYFMEEVQFIAVINAFKTTDWSRNFGSGVIKSSSANTTRGAGWAFRTLAMSVAVTPDADTALRAELLSSLTANINFYHSMYVATPNNPQGIVEPYSDYTPGDGVYMTASWMEDFFCASFGLAIDLALVSGTTKTKLDAFFAWKAQAIVGRLGGTSSTEYLYCDAAPYTIAIAPTDTPDFTGGTGPWYANWGQIYTATIGTPNPGVGGNLRGAYYPEPTSYWGNLQPAISYAVRHGVAGADAAYARMTSAPNWNDFVVAANDAPVWSVEPLFSGSPGGAVTTPGPSFVWDTVSLVTGGFVWGTPRGLGVTAAEIPTGFALPALLANDVDGADPAGTEYRVEILTGPSVGTLEVGELSDFKYTPPNGTYSGTATGTQRVYKNGAAAYDTTYSITNGTPTHDLTGAGSSQANGSGAGAITQTRVLAGAGSAQANASGVGAISQIHRPTGAASSQANTSSAAAVTQVHLLTGAACSQANLSMVGSLDSGVQLLAAAPASQSNTSAGAAITQVHALAGAASAQTNVALASSITQFQVLIGAASLNRNVAASGAIVQAQILTASGGDTQANAASGGAIGIALNLAAAGSDQSNQCTSGALIVSHTLVSAGSTQANQSLASAITAVQILLGRDCVQINLSPSASLSGLVLLPVAPPSQTFRFKPSNDSGHIPGW